jgi:hypothetical protein
MYKLIHDKSVVLALFRTKEVVFVWTPDPVVMKSVWAGRKGVSTPLWNRFWLTSPSVNQSLVEVQQP